MRNLVFSTILIIFCIFIYNNHSAINITNFFKKEISKIKVENLNYLKKSYVLNSLYLKEGDSFWKFNSKKLKSNLDLLKEIEDYNFQLSNDGILTITISEKKPYMLWSFSNKKKIIDSEGFILNFSQVPVDNLISVSGYINKKKLRDLNKVLEEKRNIKLAIKNIHYYENIGWKILFNDKKCIYLPENNISMVINIFEKIKNSKIYTEFKFFDMRILERIYLSKNHECLIF